MVQNPWIVRHTRLHWSQQAKPTFWRQHRSVSLGMYGMYTYPGSSICFFSSIWSHKNCHKCRKKHVVSSSSPFPLPFFLLGPGRSVQSFGLTSPTALQRCFYQIQVILPRGVFSMAVSYIVICLGGYSNLQNLCSSMKHVLMPSLKNSAKQLGGNDGYVCIYI